MRIPLFSILLFSFLGFVACDNPKVEESAAYPNAYDYEIVKHMKTDKAAVVTAHPLASEVGLDILKQGGNAIDASIAVQDRKSTRLNSSHVAISYAVFCLNKKIVGDVPNS